jgi:hypothetical protein
MVLGRIEVNTFNPTSTDPNSGVFLVNVGKGNVPMAGGVKTLTLPKTFPDPQVMCSFNWVNDVIVCATGVGGRAAHLAGSWFATYRHSDGVFVRAYVPTGLPDKALFENMQNGVVGYTGITGFEYVMYDVVCLVLFWS